MKFDFSHRRFVFRLRTLLLGMALIGVFLGSRGQQTAQQNRVLQDLCERGVIVHGATLPQGAVYWKDGRVGGGRSLLAQLIWPATIDMILLEDSTTTDADIDTLEQQFPGVRCYRCESHGNELRFVGYLRKPNE